MTRDRRDRARLMLIETELYYYGVHGTRWVALTLSADGAVDRMRFWFGSTEVWYDGFGGVTRTWAHVELGTPVARIENRTDLELTFHNGLGHLMAAIEPDGGSEVAYVFGPYGELLASKGYTGDHLRRFNGKESDEATGLSYYGYRYYDPLSLVWTRGDPLYRFAPDLAYDEPRRMNLYAFSLQNPLTYRDPDGRTPAAVAAWCASNPACAAGALAVASMAADVLQEGGANIYAAGKAVGRLRGLTLPRCGPLSLCPAPTARSEARTVGAPRGPSRTAQVELDVPKTGLPARHSSRNPTTLRRLCGV